MRLAVAPERIVESFQLALPGGLALRERYREGVLARAGELELPVVYRREVAVTAQRLVGRTHLFDALLPTDPGLDRYLLLLGATPLGRSLVVSEHLVAPRAGDLVAHGLAGALVGLDPFQRDRLAGLVELVREHALVATVRELAPELGL